MAHKRESRSTKWRARPAAHNLDVVGKPTVRAQHLLDVIAEQRLHRYRNRVHEHPARRVCSAHALDKQSEQTAMKGEAMQNIDRRKRPLLHVVASFDQSWRSRSPCCFRRTLAWTGNTGKTKPSRHVLVANMRIRRLPQTMIRRTHCTRCRRPGDLALMI